MIETTTQVRRLEDAIRLRTKWEFAALDAADYHEKRGNRTDRDDALERAAEHAHHRDEFTRRLQALKEQTPCK